MSWEDLSDEELRARLEQRQQSPHMAEYLVRFRDEPEIAGLIDKVLRT